MTQPQFKDISKEITCTICRRNYSLKHYAASTLRKSKCVCKTCQWIKRHNGIPTSTIVDEETVFEILNTLLSKEFTLVNDIANKFSLSLDQVIQVIDDLNVGNIHLDVKTKCVTCSKSTLNKISVYKKSENLFCSTECYYQHKRTISGRDSPFYKRITTKCTNCGVKIEVVPSSYFKTNSFGDNHNFCSPKCYWAYRSKYYRDSRGVMFGKTHSQETVEKIRRTKSEHGSYPQHLDTRIQKTVNEILLANHIEFRREEVFKYYAADVFIPKLNLIIEVMGDYWHASPLKYTDGISFVNDVQRKDIFRDKKKHTYIKKYYNIDILYLWESDINQRQELCEKLILSYLQNQGVIPDYHSFNWSLDDNHNLQLNNDLITPYFLI